MLRGAKRRKISSPPQPQPHTAKSNEAKSHECTFCRRRFGVPSDALAARLEGELQLRVETAPLYQLRQRRVHCGQLQLKAGRPLLGHIATMAIAGGRVCGRALGFCRRFGSDNDALVLERGALDHGSHLEDTCTDVAQRCLVLACTFGLRFLSLLVRVLPANVGVRLVLTVR